MKALFLSLFLAGFLTACASTAPQNTSGLEVTIKSLKDHSEGIDMSVDLHNTTSQLMGLDEKGSVSLLLDGSYHVRGHMAENVEIAPGAHETVEMRFEFINQPKLYKKGLLEIVPNKMFKNCTAANMDPDVVHKKTDGRDVSSDAVESLTCDRALKKAIRVGF